MITFDIIQVIVQRKRRWFFIVVAISIFILFDLAGLHDQQQPSIFLFMVYALNQHFFVILFVPVLFLMLISDLFLRDQFTGYMHFSFNRYSSRFSWFFSKMIALFFAAFLLTVICFVVCTVVGMLGNYKWNFSVPIFGMNAPVYYTFASIFFLFVFTLMSFGALTFLVSVVFPHPVYVWISGSFIAFASYILWFKSSASWVPWLPMAQMMYLLHVPNNRYEVIEGFTMSWSFYYTLSLICVTSGISFAIVRKKNLLKMM